MLYPAVVRQTDIVDRCLNVINLLNVTNRTAKCVCLGSACYCLRAGREGRPKMGGSLGIVTSKWNEGVNVPGQKLD